MFNTHTLRPHAFAQRGNLPFKIAVCWNAPAPVVQKIYDEYPQAIDTTDVVRQQNPRVGGGRRTSAAQTTQTQNTSACLSLTIAPTTTRPLQSVWRQHSACCSVLQRSGSCATLPTQNSTTTGFSQEQGTELLRAAASQATPPSFAHTLTPHHAHTRIKLCRLGSCHIIMP